MEVLTVWLDPVLNFVKTWYPALLTALVPVYLAVQTFQSRAKPGSVPKRPYFYWKALRTLPDRRNGYSDRMAYLMAELSELAYYEFERNTDMSQSPLVETLKQNSANLSHAEAVKLLQQLAMQFSTGEGNVAVLRSILEANQFRLLDQPVNEGTLQCFVCQNTHPDQEPFIVVAFRGSEKKVNDWLTNADAAPFELPNKAKVHSGFYTSFEAVLPRLQDMIQQAITATGDPLTPVYYTGHSLGGAWALLACTLIAPDHPGACYTFGAPRIADYQFFLHVKNPVYRVVNSADIVPRVPPGIFIVKSLYYLATLLAWITRGVLPPLASIFDKMANWVDKLKDYRHFGDQRYLTDIKDGNFDKTQLLSNPPLEDQLLWFWKGVLAGTWLYPVKSHSMKTYIEKLARIASRKNT